MINKITAVKAVREATKVGLFNAKVAVENCMRDHPTWPEEELVKEAIQIVSSNYDFSHHNDKLLCKEGRIFSYISPDGKKGVLLEVGCQTDFAAKTEEINALGINMSYRAVEKGYANLVEMVTDNEVLDAVGRTSKMLGEVVIITRFVSLEIGNKE